MPYTDTPTVLAWEGNPIASEGRGARERNKVYIHKFRIALGGEDTKIHERSRKSSRK